MDDNGNWEQRYKELQAYATKQQENWKWAQNIAELYSSNPQYQAAIRAVDEGKFASNSTPAPQFSQPMAHGQEPEYVVKLREQLKGALDKLNDIDGWRSNFEKERSMAGIAELERMEAEYRKKKPNLPDDFFGAKGRINGLMADRGFEFDQAAEIAEYLWQKEQGSQTRRADFAPMGGSPPPTDTGKEPENAEEASERAKAKFLASVSNLGG